MIFESAVRDMSDISFVTEKIKPVPVDNKNRRFPLMDKPILILNANIDMKVQNKYMIDSNIYVKTHKFLTLCL